MNNLKSVIDRDTAITLNQKYPKIRYAFSRYTFNLFFVNSNSNKEESYEES